MKENLSIRDGFNFGCGFFVAAFVYSAVIFLITGVVFAVMGTGLLTAILGSQ